jgi:hypothetical protein
LQLETLRFESAALRFELGRFRFELGRFRFELGRFRFELEALRFEWGRAPFRIGCALFRIGRIPFANGDAPFRIGRAPFQNGDVPFDIEDAPFDIRKHRQFLSLRSDPRFHDPPPHSANIPDMDDDSGFFETFIADGRSPIKLTALLMMGSGAFALFQGGTGHFLPQDTDYLGMTAAQLCTLHGCRIVPGGRGSGLSFFCQL